jgi:Mu transposase, C-terminal domain/Integrase core domain
MALAIPNQSVQRFVRKLRALQPQRIWRLECQPGEEVQPDFGVGAPIEEAEGKRRRSWVLRMVLSYSRKGYSEAVSRQDTETFLRCLENGLRCFGGSPLLLNLDNMKSAVLQADWFDPEINPKLADFCRHYGLHVVPCRPGKPQHKGKVERGVAYLRNNALKGRRFRSLAEENLFLEHWESSIADKRIHGTTRKQVAACFEEERLHLQPLPGSLFPCSQEARRSVHRDSYVEVKKAFYETPPEYVGRQVWVRWDSRCVRIFNERMEQVAMHTRIEAGRTSRSLGAGGLSAPVLSSCRYWASRAAVLGEQCGLADWAVSQPRQDRTQIVANRDVQPAAAFNDRHDCCNSRPRLLAADVDPVPSKCHGPYRVFSQAIVQLQLWIVQETGKSAPERLGVIAALGQGAAWQRMHPRRFDCLFICSSCGRAFCCRRR